MKLKTILSFCVLICFFLPWIHFGPNTFAAGLLLKLNGFLIASLVMYNGEADILSNPSSVEFVVLWGLYLIPIFATINIIIDISKGKRLSLINDYVLGIAGIVYILFLFPYIFDSYYKTNGIVLNYFWSIGLYGMAIFSVLGLLVRDVEIKQSLLEKYFLPENALFHLQQIFSSPKTNDSMGTLQMRKKFIGGLLCVSSSIVLIYVFSSLNVYSVLFGIYYIGLIILSCHILKTNSLYESFFGKQMNRLKISLIMIIAGLVGYIIFWISWVTSIHIYNSTGIGKGLLGMISTLFLCFSIITFAFMLLLGKIRSTPFFDNLFRIILISIFLLIAFDLFSGSSFEAIIIDLLFYTGLLLLFNNLLKTKRAPQTFNIPAGSKISELFSNRPETSVRNQAADFIPPTTQDIVAQLKQLKELFDAGVLTQTEFEQEKAKILSLW